jgi:hypothetical protein
MRPPFLPIGCAVLLAACGGKALPSDDTSSEAGSYGRGPDGGGSDGNSYVDPQCPDAGAPQTVTECNMFGPSGCPPGEACYPASIPPKHACESEVYGSFCLEQGVGTQGSACDNTAGCAAGFVCLITGTATQCARLCDLGSGHGCLDGFVCEPIDVPGFSACL